MESRRPDPAPFSESYPGTLAVKRATPSSGLLVLDRALVVIFILANMAHMTGLLLPVSPRSVAGAMAVEYAVIAIYGAIALLRGHILVLILGIAWVGYLMLQCFVWHYITLLPINFNAVLSYGTVLAFLVFNETRVSPRSILRYLLFFSAGYLIVYDLFWQQILGIVGHDSSIFLPSDGARGNRMYLAAPFAVLILIYGLSVLRKRPFIALPAFALSGYAMYFAQSRFALAILAIGMLAAIIGSVAQELRRAANIGLAAIFLFLSVASLGGFFVSGWNPYQMISADGSGAARATEYHDGLTALQGNVLTGFGIAANYDDVQFYVRPQRPFFASDIGVAGLAMQFGLIFIALLIFLCIRFMTVLPVPIGQMDPLYRTLFYTTQWSAFGTLVSVTILGGAGTIFAALVLVLWMRGPGGRYASPVMPSPLARQGDSVQVSPVHTV